MEITNESEPSHANGGWIKSVCQDCGFVHTELLPQVEHEWDDGVETEEATHTTVGKKTYTCDCGATKTEDIDKLPDHTYNTYEKMDADQHKSICECGDFVMKDHIWDDGEITTPATHSTEGVKTYTCVCGETYTENIEKEPHEWDDGEITTPATHLTEGVATYTCACGETYTEEVAKLDEHEWDEGVVTTPATHATKGEKTFTCPCGETYTDLINPIPHEWGDGVVTTPASHTEFGVRTFTCTCGQTKTAEIPKTTAHEWDNGEFTIAATHTSFGEKTYSCPCGESYTVWDLEKEVKVNPDEFLSMGKATPFEGWVLKGECVLTVCDGKVVYRK
jgi:hypothetical protein